MFKHRSFVLWILLLVIFLQTLSVLRGDLRGPAHIHEQVQNESVVQRLIVSSKPLSNANTKSAGLHHHSEVEHHHHDDLEDMVLMPETERHHDALVGEDGGNGAGSSLNLTALVQGSNHSNWTDAFHPRPCSITRVFRGRPLAPLERPPTA